MQDEALLFLNNMSFVIILIIITFTNSIHSLIPNYDGDVTETLLNISSLRHKRSPAEYTRWRPNERTSSEFIVKVLDDDIEPTSIKPVVAVNILPSAKNTDKIIIGGAVVPSPTTALTVAVPSRRIVQSYAGQGHYKNDPPYPQYKYGRPAHRDESPPASPQFIARTATVVARQYAPISSVVFTPRSTATLFTPPPIKRTYDIRLKPTRTSPLPDILPPTLTTFLDSDFVKVETFDEEELNSNEILISPNTHSTATPSERIKEVDSLLQLTTTMNPTTPRFRQQDMDLGKRIDKGEKIDDEKEHDMTYGMMFYIEDDIDGTKKPTRSDADDEILEQLLEQSTRMTVNDSSEISFIDITEATETENMRELEIQTERDTFHISKTNETIFAGEQLKMKQEKRIQNCSLLRLRKLNFKTPRTLPEVVAQLRHWAEHSPVAKWVDITGGNYTLMENPIYMMIVDDPSSGQIVSAKQTVMIVAGIQGRDHHAVSAALYVLYQLIERTDVHTDLLSKYRFWIIPVFNPDGYDYSITFPHRREWTKNLRQSWESSVALDACEVFGLRCSIKPCYGVNLDRNFEYQWIPPDELRAEHPCGELYAGTRQLSEVETLALTRYLHTQRVPLHTFVAFKEGDVLGIMYPYSHTKKSRAFDHVYRQRASRAASAAYGISGRPYVAGQTSQFLPLYAGGIEDWVDGHLGIDNTYTVMMFRPTDSYNSKYATEHVVHEAYAAVDTLLLHSTEPVLGPPVITLSKSSGNSHSRLFPVNFITFSWLINIFK